MAEARAQNDAVPPEAAEQPQRQRDAGSRMDWEGFFTNYRKPGFIPGYEIVNKLGSGVFGEVYKARKESIGKFYAIKFLKITDDRVSEAIFKELDALRYFAQLDHPNLVTIEDQGEVMGIPFIVMGYAGDETLKKRLSAGPLSRSVALEIYRQICSGVSALHEKSIIHFDLKPANVFLKGNHARVGDYGLSKLVSESHKTMSIGRGTPYYMAPEMLRRTGDHRSDVYSLGVILYEMLTGAVPFTGDSEWEVLKKHESDPVLFPSDLEAPWCALIDRAMAKDPAERFASVAELLADLEEAAGTARSPGAVRAAVTPVVPERRSEGKSEASRPTPPPLPSARAPKGAAPASGEVARRARAGLHAVLGAVKRRGSAAETARAEYHAARARASEGYGSFYADFEESSQRQPVQVESQSVSGDADASMRRSRPPFPFNVLWAILWPVRMILKGIRYTLKMTWRGTRTFFANFLRYAVVLALTAGLAFLIHAALRGFSL